MKNILFILLFLCAGLLQAQEYSNVITPGPGGTFNLDVITELSETRQDISRTTGLDTAGLQLLLYADIERLRQEQARKEVEILEKGREISALIAALNSQSINDYIVYQRNKLDSFYVNGAGWRISNSAGLVEDLTTLYRENNTTVLRDDTPANFAVIVPLSSNNIQLNFQTTDPLVADTTVRLYSNNGRVYRGFSDTGVLYLFRKL